MKNILVAVDGSEPSLRAAQLAVSLAGGGKLTLLHVCPPPALSTDDPFEQLPALLDAQLASGTRLLSDVAQKLAPAKVEKVVRSGSPAEEITTLADELKVDLVLLGRRGRGPISRMLLGSVADRVTHVCHQPVLVVP